MRYLAFGSLSLALLLTLPLETAAQGTGPYHDHGYGGHWLGWIFGPVMMILFIAVAAAVVVLVVRWLGGTAGQSAPGSVPPGRTPLDILKERFARGEIDKEEFESRRQVLGD